MTVQINYKNILSKKNPSNTVFFVNDKFDILSLKKLISSTEYSFVTDMLKTKDTKKQIIIFDVNSNRKIVLVSLKKNLTSFDAENLGAKFYDNFKDTKHNEYFLNSDKISSK